MTVRDEFHQFIEELDDDTVKPGLHAAVDNLDEALIPAALARMRALRGRLSDPTMGFSQAPHT